MAKIKVSDWISLFFEEKGIRDIFGYPGGMAVHLMDSLSKSNIRMHTTYNEQGAAFAACGYAQTNNKIGLVYSSSGPGFTNLITGITNAYFDSIPLLIITCNVNTYESSRGMKIKQRGFQEMNVTEVAKKITKKTYYVEDKEDVISIFNEAYKIATTDQKGPVLIDLPMDISRYEIEYNKKEEKKIKKLKLTDYQKEISVMMNMLSHSKSPIFLFGSGVKNIAKKQLDTFLKKINIPVVTSMVNVDLLPKNHKNNFGFIGAYGMRYSNFMISKADLIISIGSRLDCRQIGNDKSSFAPSAKLIRLEIDEKELTNRIKEDEIVIQCNAIDFITSFNKMQLTTSVEYSKWLQKCEYLKGKLDTIDNEVCNQLVETISRRIPNDVTITTDVGQNQVWVAQSFFVKDNQKILFSGNFGSMGYSLPSAIGAYYASGKPVFSFNGDGGLQMNIQEMQFVNRERIPIKIILLNNESLGMIRHFQEMYMDSRYTQTVKNCGYESADFEKIASAYNFKYTKLSSIDEINTFDFDEKNPELIEIKLPNITYVKPKLAMGKPCQDQEPPLDRKLYDELNSI